MGCDTLFEINKLIFDEFFRNDNDLSNLYDFLVIDNNEFCIDNITTTDFLSNNSGSLDLNAFFVGSPTATDNNCNLEPGFATFSNIVKDTADNTYDLEVYSDNTTHYIPQFSTTIIQYIKGAKQVEMRKIFNIYQIYDYLVNNPDKIATNNLDGLTLYDYFDPTTESTIVNKTDCPISSRNHKNYIENQLRGKLTPSIVYVCRGIYLVLLYKHIADVYLTYYKICDDLTSDSCGERTKTNIKTVLKQFSAVTNKIKEILNYYLDATYNDSGKQLVLDRSGVSTVSFFATLSANKHTIYNKTKNKYIDIAENINIDVTESYYPLTVDNIEGTIDSNFTNGDKCVILSKNIEYSSQVYNDSLNDLSITNETFNKNKSEYQKSIGNYNAIQGSFNNIDYIYYLTIIIVIISLIAIVATNSEQSRKTRVFIILVIVLLTYGMIFSFIEVAKRFTENFFVGSDTDIDSEEKIINNNFDMYLRIIYMESSNYGMTRLYDTLTDASNKERRNVRNNNKVLESSTNRNDATTNAEWHRLFQRTLFIHTTFLFLILVLTYLWLSTIMPDMNIYLLFVTIIASMILIFYYFRNLHRVVRTEYKHRYWTKMSV
jgi:hypothetical protein